MRIIMPLQTLFEFHNPTRVIHGAGSRARLGELLQGQKALIVTDKGLVQAGVVEMLTSQLDQAAISYAIF
ncbi:MAG: alcohol dehydrogenase, partial [Planctomycetota bacterium]